MTSKIIDNLNVLFDSIEQKNNLEPLEITLHETINKYLSKFKTEMQDSLSNNQFIEQTDILKRYILEIYNLIIFKNEFASKLTIDKFDSKEYIFFNDLCSKLMDAIIYKCFELGFDFKYLCLSQKLDVTKINLKLYNKYLQNLRIFEFNNTDSIIFPNIFSNSNSYELFLHFLEIINVSKNKLADVSFYYRKMYADKLIIDSCKPEIFKKWLTETYHDMDIKHSLKTLDDCSTYPKEVLYKSLKESFLKQE